MAGRARRGRPPQPAPAPVGYAPAGGRGGRGPPVGGPHRPDRATGCATDACEPPRAPRRRAAMAPRSRAETTASGETGPPGTEAPGHAPEGEVQAPLGAGAGSRHPAGAVMI